MKLSRALLCLSNNRRIAYRCILRYSEDSFMLGIQGTAFSFGSVQVRQEQISLILTRILANTSTTYCSDACAESESVESTISHSSSASNKDGHHVYSIGRKTTVSGSQCSYSKVSTTTVFLTAFNLWTINSLQTAHQCCRLNVKKVRSSFKRHVLRFSEERCGQFITRRS